MAKKAHLYGHDINIKSFNEMNVTYLNVLSVCNMLTDLYRGIVVNRVITAGVAKERKVIGC